MFELLDRWPTQARFWLSGEFGPLYVSLVRFLPAIITSSQDPVDPCLLIRTFGFETNPPLRYPRTTRSSAFADLLSWLYLVMTTSFIRYRHAGRNSARLG